MKCRLLLLALIAYTPAGHLHSLGEYWLRPRPVAVVNDELAYTYRPVTMTTYATWAMWYRGGIGPVAEPPEIPLEVIAMFAEMLFMENGE